MLQPAPLEPDRLTWAVLLARWTEFARTAIALPQQGELGLLRQSIADIITLQAVWFSLQQMDDLDPLERPVGIDRAGVLIARHSTAIRKRFGQTPLPEDLKSLLDDVSLSYEAIKQGT